MQTDRAQRMRLRRRWVPAAWGAYGAVYVVVFLVRGELLVAAVAAVLVALVGAGLAVELRGPRAARPQLLGWEQDERQRLIHLRSMALVGYVAVLGAAVAGFVAFLLDADAAFWPMLAVAALSGVYGIGLAFHRRRS